MNQPQSRNRQFEYLLNAMEHAAQADNPASHAYADKRRAVFDYVAKLESALSESERPLTVKGLDGEEVPAMIVMAEWVERMGGRRDHACALCVPHSDMLVAGFRCYYHTAVELRREWKKVNAAER